MKMRQKHEVMRKTCSFIYNAIQKYDSGKNLPPDKSGDAGYQ
jgi:hypothetical protein